MEQLEVLYQVRLREIEKLRNENESLQEQHRQEKCDLTATIQQLRTEKDNTIMSHNEVQKMLGLYNFHEFSVWLEFFTF